MGSINKVILMGTLGAAPELRQSSGGKPYVSISLATQKRTVKETGERRTETQWHKVTIWGKNAEIVSTYCGKGSPLMLEGHLAPYRKDDAGRMTYHVGIIAENVQLIPGTKSQSGFEPIEFIPDATGAMTATDSLQ
ncbi:MAG: single-stranded DNA-binding protein [Bdellovibrionales bacterium]|nr:single-stranded DNA-binding protein [Bdellovibrionales bacterium]